MKIYLRQIYTVKEYAVSHFAIADFDNIPDRRLPQTDMYLSMNIDKTVNIGNLRLCELQQVKNTRWNLHLSNNAKLT